MKLWYVHARDYPLTSRAVVETTDFVLGCYGNLAYALWMCCINGKYNFPSLSCVFFCFTYGALNYCSDKISSYSSLLFIYGNNFFIMLRFSFWSYSLRFSTPLIHKLFLLFFFLTGYIYIYIFKLNPAMNSWEGDFTSKILL